MKRQKYEECNKKIIKENIEFSVQSMIIKLELLGIDLVE